MSLHTLVPADVDPTSLDDLIADAGWLVSATRVAADLSLLPHGMLPVQRPHSWMSPSQ